MTPSRNEWPACNKPIKEWTWLCLIVERHDWETGALSHQLQIPLAIADSFFGGGTIDRDLSVRIFLPGNFTTPVTTKTLTISRTYRPSNTRRTNRLPELGAIPSAFIFLEETARAGVYDLWWQTDKVIVAAHYTGWRQARSSQYGRGRLALIVPAPVPRSITRV
jgi:hypothetical protein